MSIEPSTAMDQLATGSIRICIAFILTVVLLLVESGQAFANIGSAHMPLYGCGGRCYGATSWTTTTEYFGASTDIQIVHFNCNIQPSCGQNLPGQNQWFVDNEIWLTDENSADCKVTTQQQCWVEVGYMKSFGSPNNEVFFWYDQRPNFTPGFGIMD